MVEGSVEDLDLGWNKNTNHDSIWVHSLEVLKYTILLILTWIHHRFGVLD